MLNYFVKQWHQHWPLLVCLVTALILFLLTRSHFVGFLDSGYIAATVISNGVMFAPGFPTYMFLARLCSWIPLGTMVDRLLWLSHLGSLGILISTYAIVRELTKQQIKRQKKVENSHLSNLAAVISCLTVVGTYQFWSASIVIETFSLTYFIMFFILWCALYIANAVDSNLLTVENRRIFFALIFISAGLGSGLNPTVIFILGTGLVWVGYYYALLLKNLKEVLFFFCIMLVLICSVYGYLIFQSNPDKYLNWGQPNSPTRLFHYLFTSDQSKLDFRDNVLVYAQGLHGNSEVMQQSFWSFAQHVVRQTNPLLLPWLIWGIWWLYQKQQSRFWMLSGLFISTCFFETIFISGNKEHWALPALIVLAIVVGTGVFAASERYRTHAWLIVSLSFISTLLGIGYWFPKINRESENHMFQFYEDMVAPLPEGAIVLGFDSFFESQMSYLYETKTKERNILPIAFNLIFDFPWYRHHFAQYGGLKVDLDEVIAEAPSRWEMDTTLLKFLRDNPEKKVYILQQSIGRYFSSLSHGPCPSGICRIDEYYLIPDGLWYRVATQSAEVSAQTFKFDLDSFHKHRPYYLESVYKGQYNSLFELYFNANLSVAEYFHAINQDNKIDDVIKYTYFDNLPIYVIQRAAYLEESRGKWDNAELLLSRLQQANSSSLEINGLMLQLQQRKNAAEATSSANVNYFLSKKHAVSFYYPKKLSVTESDEKITLSDSTNAVSINFQVIPTETSAEEYEKNAKTYGKLLQAGFASAQGFDDASQARVWQNGNVQILQLFLQTQHAIVEVVAFPLTEANKKLLDVVLMNFSLKTTGQKLDSDLTHQAKTQ